MKFRYFLTSIIACLALAIGCTQEELPGLSGIEVTPSYFTFSVDGGSKEVAVTTSSDWTVTDIPEWLTVTPVSGNGNGKFTVSATASTDTLARTSFLKVNAGKETQLVTVNQDAFVPDFPAFKGGNYWIVFDGGAASPLTSAYGYLYTSPLKEDENGKKVGTAQNIFTFTAVEGGFTIQDPSGQYYGMQGTYDSFNVFAELPETGGVWTVKQTGATAYEVVNTSNGKVMQYDPNYSSAGAYSSSRGVLPHLLKVEIVPEPEPLGDATAIEDIVNDEPEVIIEGLVTATCTRGVIITDETASIYAYGAPEVAIGDKVKFLGTFSNYNKGYQLKDIIQHEIASSENEVVYPEPVVLTENAIAGIISPLYMLAQYASVEGIVEVDSYNNALITVGDYKVKTNYYAESFADYAGKAIELKGYVISYKESASELNMVVTSFEELTDWTPEVPEPEVDDIKDVVASETTVYNVEGTVVASGSSAYIIADATGNLIVYGKEHGRTVGEKVKVSGTAAHYSGYKTNTVQLTPTEVEVVSTGNSWTYNPTVLDGAALDALIGKDASCTEVQFTGSLAISGKYANITVEGATNTGSLSNVDVVADYSSFDGKTVVVKGYITGTYGRLSVQPYSVVAVDSE